MAKARTDAPSTAEKAVGGSDPIKPDTQTADTADARVAVLEAQLAEANATIGQLREELERQHQERAAALKNLHDRFDEAWAQRERELGGEQRRGPTVGGKVVTGRRYAVGWVRAHREGKPVSYQPGAEIHEDTDLTGVDPGAIQER